MRSILFVCTANLCRSPTAEGVLRTLLAREGLKGLKVDSAGTHDYQVGMTPARPAVEVARNHGYDITGRVARRIVAGDLDSFDMILAMDDVVLINLKSMSAPRMHNKMELLLKYGVKYQGQEIPDPYGRKKREFKMVLDMIEDGCRGLVALLKRQAGK